MSLLLQHVRTSLLVEMGLCLKDWWIFTKLKPEQIKLIAVTGSKSLQQWFDFD